jgi:hypothetical protein
MVMFNKKNNMSIIKTILGAAFIGALLTTSSLAANTAKKGEKLKPYTLNTCLVTDEKLGSMGKPYPYTYKDREVKFCCKGCVKDFDKEPAKFIKKLEEAEKKGKKSTASAHGNHKGHKH